MLSLPLEDLCLLFVEVYHEKLRLRKQVLEETKESPPTTRKDGVDGGAGDDGRDDDPSDGRKISAH